MRSVYSFMFYACTHILQGETEDDSDGAVDSRGIPSWEKVDSLARALLDLQGLYVTNSEAKRIKELHSQLLEYDKKPMFRLRPVKPTKGRFARSKGAWICIS